MPRIQHLLRRATDLPRKAVSRGIKAPRQGLASGRQRRNVLLPLVTGLVAVLLLAAAALAVGSCQLGRAEQRRLDDRADLVESTASNRSLANDPHYFAGLVDQAGFSSDDPARNQRLLQIFEAGASGNTAAVVALLRPDGTAAATLPAGESVPVADLGAAWPAALAGRPGWTDVFSFEGRPLRAELAPVGGSAPWAVLVLITPDVAEQRFNEQIGSLGGTTGGLSDVDSRGVTVASWDPDLVGRRVVDPARLDDVPAGQLQWWTAAMPAGAVETISVVQPRTGYATVYQEPAGQLYADLRARQSSRDRALLAVLSASVAVLVLFAVAREVTARRSRARLHDLLSNAHDVIILVRDGDTVAFMSPSADRLLGQSSGDWLGRRLVDLVHEDDRGMVSELVAELVDGLFGESGTARTRNVRLRTADGGSRWFDLEASDQRGDPDLFGVLVTCHEVGERKSLEDRLSHQARHDALTGLCNRVTFVNQLAAAITAANETGTSCAVLFVDLDRFKHVNDTRGHDAGDALLKIVARRIGSALRPGEVAARFGGDEFGVLLRADAQTALAVARRVADTVRLPIDLGDATVQVDASIGVALPEPGQTDADQVLRAADIAMYKAKRQGQGPRVVLSDDVARPVAPAAVSPRPPPGDAIATDEGRRATPVKATARRSTTAGAAPGRRPRWKTRARRLAPLLMAGVVLLAVVAVGLWQEVATRDSTRSQRLVQNQSVATALAGNASYVLDPARLEEKVNDNDWSFDDPSADARILSRIRTSVYGGPGSELYVTTLDGRVLAADPGKEPLTISPDSLDWRLAASGNGRWAAPVTVGGTQHVYGLTPIRRDGTTVAVLVIARPTNKGPLINVLRSLRPLGQVSYVFASGVATFSSDVARSGELLAAPEALAAVPAGQAARVTAGVERDLVSFAAPVASLPGYFVLYQQPAAVVYQGLGAPVAVTVGLFGVAAATLVGVAVANDRRQRAVRREASEFAALLRNAHDFVLVVDDQDEVTFVSSAVSGLLGHQPDDWLGRAVTDLAHREDAAALRTFLHAAPRVPPRQLRDLRLPTAEGGYRWFDVIASDFAADAALSGTLLTCHDIVERKTLEEELASQASRDPLTGLPNRSAFRSRLAEVASSRRDERGEDGERDDTSDTQPEKRRFAVLFIDLDHFKPVNDTYGHDVGDQVLTIVAMRLGAAVRVDDSVARLGGDEFAVIVPHGDEAYLADLADRILHSVRQPINCRGTDITISATIGGALSAVDVEDPTTAVRAADRAMYEAKRRGRNRTVVATASTAGRLPEARPSSVRRRGQAR
ncbi:diguanylate cyclase domain-containing protein [Frankia sp. QA3]|uniref:diguanylate cyclase domain-containing protein n=1 Tax=Frankia sp. QA3 TaxID=710111 RepID=UPI0018DEECB0|nr:diguanylate cyclase [Frankia sp. QA3]